MGSDPFPAVALSAEDNRTYTLLGPIADSLMVFQDRYVRIYGKLKGETVYTEESIEIIRYEILLEEQNM